jgi:hypothetical protein
MMGSQMIRLNKGKPDDMFIPLFLFGNAQPADQMRKIRTSDRTLV